MNEPSQVVRTKLTPPRLPRHTLARPRLSALLAEARHYRLTLVQAGTGYGKSTALAALAEERLPLAWYHLDAEDADPQAFLLHLVYALESAVSPAPLALLEQWDQTGEIWTAVTDALINELTHLETPLLLVLDDAHHLNQTGETLRVLDRLIGRAPRRLHIILASRYPLQLPTLLNWRVRGEVLEIGQETLAFTPTEISTLFCNQFQLPLTNEQIELLSRRSEGWPIALQLVWQRLHNGAVSLPEALGQLSGGELFAYLAREVLAQQPQDVQAFLQETSVLRRLNAEICNALRSSQDSAQLLRFLRENSLFIVDLGGGHMRYHHLFRDLIVHQLPVETAAGLYRRAAEVYCARQQHESAIYYYLEAGAYRRAAQLLAQAGRDMVQAGRLDTLSTWIGSLPPDELVRHPPLLVFLGDIARLRSHFDEALGWYKQAETHSRAAGNVPAIGQALRGQARVYLDTVNPSQAEQLLQEALRLSDGLEDRETRARLLDLLAENLLNQGQVEKARQFQAQARELRHEGPDAAELPVRLLLRTGRLDEARRLLEERLQAEKATPVQRPRAHRETLLILSLVLSLQGEREQALQHAAEGTRRGEALHSHFITAVGHMRQGHAWLLQKKSQGYENAIGCFQEAVQISERLEVPRLKVEAFWGLCQAYGFQGDLLRAQETATRGIALARAAGDEWVTACIQVTLGAAYTLTGATDEALPWLTAAYSAYRNSGDTYGQTITRLWQSLVWHKKGDKTRLERDVTDLLRLLQYYGYEYVVQRRTLLGPPDPRLLVPLLLFGRDHTAESGYAAHLLQAAGLQQLQHHPGFQLRLRLLGNFEAWRGREAVTARDWKRKKSRQLFLLLLTCRHAMLEREQIVELLWPELPPETARRDFKIAYSALINVLEPGRERNEPSSFLARDDTRYGLRPEADIWLDTAVFERHMQQGNDIFARQPAAALPHYREAIELYRGDYLQEYRYEEWCSEERERLSTLYLQTAERLSLLYLQEGEAESAVRIARRILAQDDCWENAYRILMQAYAAQGNHAQAIRVYQRCRERLQAELGISPAPSTRALFKTLTNA